MSRPHFIDTCSTLFLAFTFVALIAVVLLKKRDLGIENLDTICDQMCYDADSGKIKATDFVLIDTLHAACAPCPRILFFRPNERKFPEKWIRIKSWPNKTTVIYNNYEIAEFQRSFQVVTDRSLTTLKNDIFRTQF